MVYRENKAWLWDALVFYAKKTGLYFSRQWFPIAGNPEALKSPENCLKQKSK